MMIALAARLMIPSAMTQRPFHFRRSKNQPNSKISKIPTPKMGNPKKSLKSRKNRLENDDFSKTGQRRDRLVINFLPVIQNQKTIPLKCHRYPERLGHRYPEPVRFKQRKNKVQIPVIIKQLYRWRRDCQKVSHVTPTQLWT